jgi:macrophage erythroblast attacher
MTSIKEAAKAATTGKATAEDSLRSLDAMISRMQGFKRKVETLHEEEKILHGHQRKRISHLQDLYNVENLLDPGYDRWSRIRLDRLLVDFLLRSGFCETAAMLAEEKDIKVCGGEVVWETLTLTVVGTRGRRCVRAVLQD